MQTTPSTCEGCGAYCSVLITVEGGEVAKVTGNPANLATGGAVCPVLQATVQQVNDPDRVLTPLRRRNPLKGRGEDPQFQPITWDEALDEIADRMMALRQAGEAHKLVLSKGRSTGISDVLFKALPDIYGTPNRITHDTICAEAEKLATGNLDGAWSYHDYDFANTRCIIMWGTDPLVSNRHKPHLLATFNELKSHAALFVVDPHRSYTAQRAGEGSWIATIPGTDGALALAIAHVLLRDGLWNRDYVGDFPDGVNRFASGEPVDSSLFGERHTLGLVSWWNEEVRFRTPEWAQGICGVNAETIEHMARTFAEAGSGAISWVSPGVTMSARGACSGMACYALNGLAGSIGAEGGVLCFPSFPTSPIPDTAPYQDETAREAMGQPFVDQRQRRGIMAAQAGRIHKNYLTNHLADSILDDNPYAVRMMIGYWNNFAFSCSGTDRWERALSKLPFFVHITTNISETTHFADIVLPAAHHLFEAWGFMPDSMQGRTCVSLKRPSLPARGDCKNDEAEIPYLLAEKLAERGLPSLLEYYLTEFTDPETGEPPADGVELSRNAVKIMTRPAWEPMGWEAFLNGGVACSDRTQPRKPGDDVAPLPTPSGKFEFTGGAIPRMVGEYAQLHGISPDDAVAELGYECPFERMGMPHWEEPVRIGDERDYPFVFSQHRAFASLEGRSANTPLFQDMKKADPGDVPWDDVVKLHPDDMARLGLEDGQDVRLVSPVGGITVHARAWDGVLPGVVSKCYGQGHWAYGHVAALDFDNRVPRGGNANEILPDAYERLSGSTVRHGGIVRVRVEKR